MAESVQHSEVKMAEYVQHSEVKMAESVQHSEEDVYTVCKKDIMDNLDWLKATTDDQKKLLRDYLLNLDRSMRVDFNSARSKIICKGVHDIMKQICQKMKENDPRFSGNLVPMGSANNETKIDDLNEFDFVHEMNESNLLKGYTIQDLRVNRKNLQTRFRKILSIVLQELELPPGWCHGGLNRPKYSGFRRNGIACLLQFDYVGKHEKTPLRLSVDFVPMIRIPIVTENRKPLDFFLTESPGVDHCWASLEDLSCFYSNAEELWLKKYSPDSMPKTLMGLGKYLEVLLKMKYKCPVPKEELQTIKNGTPENSDLPRWSGFDGYFFDCDKYVTYSDIGETIGDKRIVKSYCIKRAVMHMMMSSESRGREWTEDDLPDLLMCVYRILADPIIMPSHLLGEIVDIEFVEDKFSVPLEEKLEINEDLKYSIKLKTEHRRRDFNLEDALTFLPPKNEVFDGYMDIFHKKMLASRMSAVFQLLRRVCEGHNTAYINTYKGVPLRGHPIHRDYMYVTKEDYCTWQ